MGIVAGADNNIVDTAAAKPDSKSNNKGFIRFDRSIFRYLQALAPYGSIWRNGYRFLADYWFFRTPTGAAAGSQYFKAVWLVKKKEATGSLISER